MIPVAAATVALLSACGGDGASSSSEGPRVEGDAVGVVGAHEHGVARLALAAEGSEVFITLEAPGDVLFGFEREPETDEEWSLVAERIAALEAGLASAFVVAGDLDCRASGPVEIEGAPERHEHDEEHDHEDEEGHDHEEEHGHEDEQGHEEGEGHDHEGEHTEVSAEVTVVCSAPVAGRDATLGVASLLPNLEQIDLTILTETGQAAARVAGDASFSF